MPVTRDELMKLQKRAQVAIARAKSIRDQTDAVVGHVVQTLEVGAMAFGMGMVNGRWQGAELVGLPVDLMTGLALHAMGLFSESEENALHLHNFGDGATASFFTTLGVGVGKRWREDLEAKALPAPTSPPSP